MSLQLYNTLTSRKEPFVPADPGHAKIYVCGPTVYDYAHLGHARCYVVYDVLVRHLRASGMRVTYARNLTNVDDKILRRAKESGEDPIALADRFTVAYAEDMARLGNLSPDVEPKVSDHLDEIRALVSRLLDRGAAYVSDGDVYFSVPAFAGYGKLSHRRVSDLEAGASGRTTDEEAKRKRHPADFALWKRAEPGELSWPSPWGPGRPGWHIECSAMSMRHLGETFDLHGGGLDLVFPHHENEIAQSEAATGRPFVRMWMHNGFVEASKEKMSKSLGNVFNARDLFARVEPEAVRYVMLTVHYRTPLNLDWTLDASGRATGFPQFEDAEKRVEYLYAARRRVAELPATRVAQGAQGLVPEIEAFPARVRAALDDDLNMPVALAAVSEFLRAVNDACDRAEAKGGAIGDRTLDAVRAGFGVLAGELGLGTEEPTAILDRIQDRRAHARGIERAEIEAQITERTTARRAKDFARADAIRDALAARGVELCDGPRGTTWRIH